MLKKIFLRCKSLVARAARGLVFLLRLCAAKTAAYFKNAAKNFRAGIKKRAADFAVRAREFGGDFKRGTLSLKASYFIMGFKQLSRRQFLRGFLFLGAEMIFIAFMVFSGGNSIRDFLTLGRHQSGFDPVTGAYIDGDSALLMLLFGVFTLFVIVMFLVVYFKSVYYARILERGGKVAPAGEDLKSLLDGNFHFTMLLFPIGALMIFTIIPLVFMILLAFTDYSTVMNAVGTPKDFFNWSGFGAFKYLFLSGNNMAATFWGVLGWTFIWAIAATFLNYFLGMFVAMLINMKGLKCKGLFRTALVISIAVPQFIMLLVLRTFLTDHGVLNTTLTDLGLIKDFIPFLSDKTTARFTVIIANLWVGIPYTMLITSGILMNIPEDLYEAARIDGAGPIKLFIKITMPYVLFITAPYLITQFVGNINNFNVIYLLTGGGPLTTNYYGAGYTDLLITWLFKLTKEKQDYSVASAIGIMIFIISASISLVFYRRTAAYKREGEFA